ncbi:MAG: hydantoinase/oxoprolinase family protein [Planctomycetota bacterium]|jgi:probable H4MPT-linked C1 transfer pathway protein
MTKNRSPSTRADVATIAPWLGLDIGGANLKAAHTQGWTRSTPFPMWRLANQLGLHLAKLIDDAPAFDGVALTMTGELADCFATRSEGVAVILEQVTSILPAPMVRVYCVDGSWRSPSQAAREPWMAAASNWHALAQWSSRWIKQPVGIVIDVGSTTIDVIPIDAKGVATRSMTDSQRLRRRELLYTGVERSNLAGVIHSAPLFGARCPVMNELFATTRDVYLWLGKLQADPADCDTADGRPANRESARYRLARVVGEDGSTLADGDISAIAEHVYRRQTSALARAIGKVSCRLDRRHSPESTTEKTAILCGHGEFLAQAALQRVPPFADTLALGEILGPEMSRSAPAFAVANLAAGPVPVG